MAGLELYETIGVRRPAQRLTRGLNQPMDKLELVTLDTEELLAAARADNWREVLRIHDGRAIQKADSIAAGYSDLAAQFNGE